MSVLIITSVYTDGRMQIVDPPFMGFFFFFLGIQLKTLLEQNSKQGQWSCLRLAIFNLHIDNFMLSESTLSLLQGPSLKISTRMKIYNEDIDKKNISYNCH